MTEVNTQAHSGTCRLTRCLDTGDVIWEPAIVNSFVNAPLYLSQASDASKACFEQSTITTGTLLDEIRFQSEAEGAKVLSEHLLASIGDPLLFKWCMSLQQ